MVIELFVNFANANPILSIILVSIFITLISTLVTKWMTNQEHLKGLKDRQKELQNELKKCEGDECKMKEVQMEMLQITGTMMKSSFKPLLVTFIPFLILFYWVRGFYGELLGGWFWYYLIASFASSMIFRKVFKMA